MKSPNRPHSAIDVSLATAAGVAEALALTIEEIALFTRSIPAWEAWAGVRWPGPRYADTMRAQQHVLTARIARSAPRGSVENPAASIDEALQLFTSTSTELDGSASAVVYRILLE